MKDRERMNGQCWERGRQMCRGNTEKDVKDGRL